MRVRHPGTAVTILPPLPMAQAAKEGPAWHRPEVCGNVRAMLVTPRHLAFPLSISAALLLASCSSRSRGEEVGTPPPPDSPIYDDTTLVREPAPMETPEEDRREAVEEGIDTLRLGARWQVPEHTTPFVASGLAGVLGTDTTDATRIGAVVRARVGELERIVLSLSQEGGLPAERAGRIRVELLRDLGVVRVQLPGPVVQTEVTERHFAGRLARAAYVVRPLGAESLYVDVHLAGPQSPEVRAYLLEDPALVVLEFRAGDSPWAESHRTSRHAVVLTPPPGTTAYPLEIAGYARTFEATVQVELWRDGEILARRHVQAADYTHTWGAYRTTIEDGPRGDLLLRVGEYSARDGTWGGVAIPLTIR